MSRTMSLAAGCSIRGQARRRLTRNSPPCCNTAPADLTWRRQEVNAIAGGFAPRAFKRTVELNHSAQGQQIKTEVPLDYPLRPGDTVLVKERWF
jgi:hypothetical protein